jgi:hypothetical protein
MIKASVKNLQNIETHFALFETQELAEQWFNLNKFQFGKLARTLFEIQFTDESIEDAIDSEETLDGIVYSFPDAFTVEYTDVTVDVNYEKEAREARAYLASTDWYIIRKTETGVDIPAEITLLRAEARLKI